MPTATDLSEGVDALSTLAARDLRRLWTETSDPVAARKALDELLVPLTRAYSSAATTLAADWYDESRAEAAVRGRFRAIPAAVETPTDAAGLAVGPLFGDNPDWRRAQVLASGTAQRFIANASRNTITRSTLADPSAQGWQRTGSGACAFCAMLIGRGAVYRKSTVRFAAHDNCSCQAVPAWGGQPVKVKPFTPSARRATDADRKRVREYLAVNNAG